MSLNANVDIRLPFFPNYPFNGLSYHPFFFFPIPPVFLHILWKKRNVSDWLFPSKSFFQVPETWADTFAGGDELAVSVCLFKTSFTLVIEGSMGVCKERQIEIYMYQSIKYFFSSLNYNLLQHAAPRDSDHKSLHGELPGCQTHIFNHCNIYQIEKNQNL